MISAAMGAVLVGLLLLGVPIGVAAGAAASVGVALGGVPLELVPRMMTEAVDSFTLLAAPFFVLAGHLMNTGGVTARIFDFAHALAGHLRGGLAHVNVVGSMIFAGMSGSAMADLAGLGGVEMKAMRAAGYHPAMSAAVTLASCTIGVVVPPSISYIVYALVTGESTFRLFIAGIVPGLVIGALQMLFVYGWAVLRPRYFAAPEPFELRALGRAAHRGSLALLLPLVIMGSMVSGVATPAEVGVIAVLYALALGFVYRENTARRLLDCAVEATTTTALMMYIVAVSSVISWVVTSERAAHAAVEAIAAHVGSPLAALALINLLLLFVGTIMDGLAALLIAASILHPVIVKLGIDPIHFGVVICFNLIIGIITPPVGIGLFVAARVARVPVERVLAFALPMLIPLLVSLAVITAFPRLSTWLPDLVLGPRR